ncbi:autotransporter outer membrane beta-barrel domain-containing protein [Pantoea sp. KPR_PJ]|uniref:autotransporter outer membrane beta-barrel domain-containing protein n=1 Tax=Pantoea sp. KPR_PJ TaxID=2738375 RepID=UPI003528BDAA
MKTGKSAHPQFTVLFVTLLLSPLSALAWDNLTVFGDSLSDGGNIGRYTWDGEASPIYDEILAARLGQSLRASSQGGSNYAQGFAVSSPQLNAGRNTENQLAAYLNATGGRADSNGLYIHWVGGNDIAAAAMRPLTARETLSLSAAAATAQVKTLLEAGAGAVIVPTTPQVGETPYLIETVLSLSGPASDAATAAAFQSLNSATTSDSTSRQQAVQTAFAQAATQLSAIPAVRAALAEQLYQAWQQLSSVVSALTAGYNQQQEYGLATLDGNIVRVDVAGLFSEVIADPRRYGLTNTVGMACPVGTSAAACTSATPGFSRNQSYLFADRLHPSPAVHALIADYIQSILDAPLQAAALSRAPYRMARDMQNTLDGHLQQQRHQQNSAGQFSLFGGYAGEHVDEKGDAYFNGEATTASFTLGVGYQITEKWQTGVLFSTTNQRQAPSSDYDYRLRGNLIALYSQLEAGDGAWVNADLHYADLDFDNIERTVNIGPATRIEQGNTGGKLLGMRVQAGWDMLLSTHLTTGPFASYALDYGRAGGYHEQGNSSTAMRYSDQTRHSQTGAVGWRIDSQQWPVNPWAQVSYNHQFGDSDSTVTAGLKSTRTAFSRTTGARDTNWLDVAVGATIPLGERISAFTGVSAEGGNRDGRQLSWNIGVNATF